MESCRSIKSSQFSNTPIWRQLLKLKGSIENFFLEIFRIVKTIICKGPGNGCFYIDFADKIGKIIFELSTEFQLLLDF